MAESGTAGVTPEAADHQYEAPTRGCLFDKADERSQYPTPTPRGLHVVEVSIPLCPPHPLSQHHELVSWLVQEIEDLLDAGSVGLYELIWAINSKTQQLDPNDLTGIAEQALERLMQKSEIELVQLKWPADGIDSSNIRIDSIGRRAWNEPSQDGAYYALRRIEPK